MTTLFEIRSAGPKGLGVFAKTAIPRNTIIMTERPILDITHPTNHPAAVDASIEAAFAQLSLQDQAKVLQLHEGSHPNARTKVTRILHANSFGREGGEKLFLTISRINHSCVPNARCCFYEGANAADYIISDKDIAAGEEIAISYLPPFSECMTADRRGEILNLTYAFDCRCPACWPAMRRCISDARRQLIDVISHALQGQKPLFARQSQPRTALRPAQKVEYNFLLASLREAEGLLHHS